jgi:hypothetical protein
MRPSPRPRGTPSVLSDSVHHQLNMYALAASTAGVGLLALTPPAMAKIVFTKADQVIGCNGIYELDLNHDRLVDFLIQQIGFCNSYGTINQTLLAKGALGNAVEGSKRYASALKAGQGIGPHPHFTSGATNGATMVYIHKIADSSSQRTYGRWINVNNLYLGLKLKIKGETHYGWARLSVHDTRGKINVMLTGFAHETVPKRSIRAGQTSGGLANDTTSPEAAPHTTLGTLSLGAHDVRPRRQP